MLTKNEIHSSVKVYKRAEISKSSIGLKSIIGNDTIISECQIEDYVSVNRRNYLLRSSIGVFTYTGIGTMIRSSVVGKFCSISWNVSIGGGNHVFDHLTTHPRWRFNMMSDNIEYSKNKELQKTLNNQADCIIENDVWIATNAVILRGVTIGNGAVIGAGAVITKDVEPYSIVVGVPAKPIKKRFDERTIEELQGLQWWNWPIEVIRENIELIYSEKVNDSVISRLKEISREI